MIIVSIVKNETEVGITIVHPHLYMVDTEVANRYNLINEGSLEVGNTIGKPNGSE
jgi:hypothetical protein